MSKNWDKAILLFMLISLFLFRIPNFYLMSFIKNAFLTTQSIARLILIFVFVYEVIYLYVNRKSYTLFRDKKILLFLITIFFLLQSLSIFESINTLSFLRRYKDVIIGFISFFVFLVAQLKYKEKLMQKLLYIFLFSFLINIIFQFFLLFFPSQAIHLFSNTIYSEYWQAVIGKLNENKIYLETFDEAVVPLLIFMFWHKSLISRLYCSLISIFLIFFAYLSNIRSRLAVLITCVIGIFWLFKIKLNKLILFVAFIFFLLIVFDIVGLRMNSYTLFDRFSFTDELQDVKSITSRLDQIKLAFDIGTSKLLGVGLGNYYEYVDTISQERSRLFNSIMRLDRIGAIEYPHNIFALILAETGVIGLTIFFIILLIMIKSDIKIATSKKDYRKIYVIMFWSLFVYGLLNPPIPGSYQVLFWGLRGLLI